MIEHLTDKINGVVVHLWPSNFFVEPDNTTVENEFQAEKCMDLAEMVKVLAAAKSDGTADPALAKKLGRKIQIRPGWNDVRVDIMERLVLRKAFDHAEFVEWLLESGDEEIVEGNWWHDNFWGRCFCKKCESHGVASQAKNMLGKTLMKVRLVIVEWDESDVLDR